MRRVATAEELASCHDEDHVQRLLGGGPGSGLRYQIFTLKDFSAQCLPAAASDSSTLKKMNWLGASVKSRHLIPQL